MKCPCGNHAACVPGCALMDYPGYYVEWASPVDPEMEADGHRTAYPEMPYSPPLPDVTRTPRYTEEELLAEDAADVASLVDEIDEWYAAHDPFMAGAGDGNSPPWVETEFVTYGKDDTEHLSASQTNLDRILEARGSRYGKFYDNSLIAQNIKAAVRDGKAYGYWPDIMREALDQIAAKLSRAATGDPDYVDNWDDIAGYAKLVAEWLRETQA